MPRNRALLGQYGARLYPPRPNLPTQRRGVVPAHASNNNGLFSRQSLMVLTVGMLMGYTVLPMLLMSHFDNEHQQYYYSNGKHAMAPDGVTEPTTLMSPPKYSYEHGFGKGALPEPQRRISTELEDAEQTLPDPVGEGEEEEEQPSQQDTTIADDQDEAEEADEAEETEETEPDNKSDGHSESVPTIPKKSITSEAKQDSKAKPETERKTIKSPIISTDDGGPIGWDPKDSSSGSSTVATEGFQRIIEDQDILGRQSLPTSTTPHVMKTKKLPDSVRMKILVTGGAGFVGSHLVDKLMMEGHEVIVVDNFFTGQKKNIAHWLQHPNFSVIVHDVTEPIHLEVDQIYHLACPASPPHYQYNPVKTIKTSTMGTLNMLGLAKRVHARMLLTSTSEIYGDPQIHPQPESYWGNVNTIGPRSCYDEGKRVAETMMYSYKQQNGVDVRVARIFNTFGPRMHPNDGRVVSNFIIQALQNKNLTIYGEGKQTRSFQYVSDLVNGLHKLMNGNYDLPVNLGNPDEYSVASFASYIKQMTNSNSSIINLPKSQDDPSKRRPDISTAQRELGWSPQVTVKEGLVKTITYFQHVLDESGEIIPTGPGAAKPEA